MLRRLLVELFITRKNVHELPLQDEWGAAQFLRYAPRNLVQNVQRHVVSVAAKLERAASRAASSSSSAPPATSGVVRPPPGLECFDAVVSFSLGAEPEGEDDDLADVVRSESPPSVPTVAEDAAEYSAWWTVVVGRFQEPCGVLPPSLVFQPHGRFPWHVHSDEIAAHIFRQTGERGPRWISGKNTVAMKQHVEAGSPHVDVVSVGSLSRACGTLHSWMLHRPSSAESWRGQPHLLDVDLVAKFCPTGLMFGWDLAGAETSPAFFSQRGFHATSL